MSEFRALYGNRCFGNQLTSCSALTDVLCHSLPPSFLFPFSLPSLSPSPPTPSPPSLSLFIPFLPSPLPSPPRSHFFPSPFPSLRTRQRTDIIVIASFLFYLRWRGSIYQLMWKEALVFIIIYYCFSFTYRFILTEAGKRHVSHRGASSLCFRTLPGRRNLR